MGYIEAGHRIGLALESALPEIRENIPHGCDFRPGNHGDVIVSGVRIKLPPNELFPEASDVAEDGPVKFLVIFGGMERCEKAYKALLSIGIHADVVAPHSTVLVCDGEEIPIRVGTWRLVWELPQDFTLV